MAKPSPCFISLTSARAWMRSGAWPARPRLPENAMAKQPAWAAAISSSGLVPEPSSKRELNEYGPLNAPLPSSTVPLPSTIGPSQTAVALRVGMNQPPPKWICSLFSTG